MKLNYTRTLTDAQGRHRKGDLVTAGPRRCKELLDQGMAEVIRPARKPTPKPAALGPAIKGVKK